MSKRVNWLCQCGNGRLNVLERELPMHCPMCNHPVRTPGRDLYWAGYDNVSDSEAEEQRCGFETEGE